MADFCRQGYWIVLPYSAVRHWPSLRVSPLGAVPQRDRRPRLIVDYSFSAVNQDTVSLAPPEAMQFGRALHRILSTIVSADPRYGPVYLSKIDIADGFYRVWLRLDDIPKLGVILPTSPGQPPLIAFPLALPMGWVESPPYFTVLTETACDLANARLRDRSNGSPRTAHRLESVAATRPAAPAQVPSAPYIAPPSADRHAPVASRTGRPPVAAVDVYVDDFVLMAQTENKRQSVLRSALHSIDAVFRPLALSDPNHRTEPASVKKMLKGDAAWATQKRVLGWDLDTEASTLRLPAHRIARLYELLDKFSPPHKRASVKLWHQLLGELRSMAPALPGARGLFSILQHSLGRADRNRVKITRAVWDMAADFRSIADTLRDRPTRLQELVPTTPSHIGACDACQHGMGGVWFSNTGTTPMPILWRQAFPVPVQHSLITRDRPQGTISISDLELAALVAHKDVLTDAHYVAERTLWMATDNRAALSWSDKGSSTSTAARAYLLRLNALHQRRHRYVPTHNHIAGKANVMADDASISLATLDAGARDQLHAAWRAVQEATSTRVSRQRFTAAGASCRLWSTFCDSLAVDADHLPSDPIPLLQVFAQRLRDGSISASRGPSRSRSVEETVRAVGQAYAGLGAPDPRLDAHGNIDFRLSGLFRSWARVDPPPSRVKPLPMSLLALVVRTAFQEDTPGALAAANTLIMGYFFLLRPGEYLGRPRPGLSDDLFRLRDLAMWVGSRAIDPCTCPLTDLQAATFATLTFTRQKNGVRGEKIGHGRSGHPQLCPVLCLVARVVALRQIHAPPDTPLNAFGLAGQPLQHVSSPSLTARIRSALAMHPDPSYAAHDVSSRSTRAGGAMALLCAGVDRERLRMIGRWRSDEMYRYLHIQAQPLMTGISAAMLAGGSFRLAPG